MTSFDERENAFEAKFAHDSELQFKAEARRNKIVAHWAAGLLGKTDDEISAYVGEVIRSDMEESGSEDVVRKLVADLTGHATEDEIRQQLEIAMLEAKRQIAAAT